ncbi:MAG: hypothetical protein AAF517_08810 [Planctomycetota bacterium]
MSPDEVLGVMKTSGVPVLDTFVDVSYPRIDNLAALQLLDVDCDGSGVSDYLEIQRGILADEDEDGEPDVCRAPFLRGDANVDGKVDLSDVITILDHLFRSAEALRCERAADTDDNDVMNLTDAVYLAQYLFLEGPGLADPGPTDCGFDPTPGVLTCGEASCP